MPIAVMATAADVGHLHQLRQNSHHAAAIAAGEHAHDLAAAAGNAAATEHATKTAGNAAKAPAAPDFGSHHLTHHRTHGLNQRGETALAHFRFHHV